MKSELSDAEGLEFKLNEKNVEISDLCKTISLKVSIVQGKEQLGGFSCSVCVRACMCACVHVCACVCVRVCVCVCV